MRPLLIAAALTLLGLLIAGASPGFAGQVEISTTPTETATIDPCVEEPVDEAGEEVDPCATATIDPCQPGETEGGERADPCITVTPTETVVAEKPTATMTPTLEYEIDVPVSFFPTETGEAEVNETVAAATEPSEVEAASVTGLPNAGGTGPTDGPNSWFLTIAILVVLGSLGMLLRVRPTFRA